MQYEKKNVCKRVQTKSTTSSRNEKRNIRENKRANRWIELIVSFRFGLFYLLAIFHLATINYCRLVLPFSVSPATILLFSLWFFHCNNDQEKCEWRLHIILATIWDHFNKIQFNKMQIVWWDHDRNAQESREKFSRFALVIRHSWRRQNERKKHKLFDLLFVIADANCH